MSLNNNKKQSLPKFHFLLSYGSKELLMHMNDEDRSHLLKTIMKNNPSENTWNDITELFAVWPDNQAKEKAFELANEGMNSWSDKIRHVNSSWGLLYNNHSLSPVAKIVRSISISRREQNGNQELIKIVSSPFIKDLRALTIERSEIYIEGITALVTSPFLQQLRYLSLHGLTLSNEEFSQFFNATNLPALTNLAITGMSLNNEKIGWLLESSMMKQLEKLDISYDSIDDEKALLISKTQNLSNLKFMNLSGNYLRNKGVKHIIEGGNFKSLQELNISNNKIDEETKRWIMHLSGIYVIT